MRARPWLRAAAAAALVAATALVGAWRWARHAPTPAGPASAATGAASPSRQEAGGGPAALAQAVERGAACLAGLPRIAPDALWALGEARSFAPEAHESAWGVHRPRLDADSILRRVIDPTLPPPPPNPRAGGEPGDPAGLLLAHVRDALSCAAAAPPPRLAAFVAEDHAGYVLTHQYLAIEWARRSGCRVPTAWAARQRALVEDVLRELALDPAFDDLFAEQLFVVAHAGDARRLEPAWVATLLQHQADDGCWRDPAPIEARLGDAGFTASASVDHTTALALYTLARVAHAPR